MKLVFRLSIFISVGFLLLFGACTPFANQETNFVGTSRNPRNADVPLAPVLATIRPNPDYDKNVFIQWTAVSGATSYKVYRNTSEITTIGGLTPIGTPTTTYYKDNGITSAGTYWYAVVATNTSGDSGLSNSLSTTVCAGGSSLVFWEDFDNDTFDANPFPWTSNNNFPSSMFFCARGSWGIGSDHPTPYLDVGDNQGGDYVWGYANLPTTLTDGSLALDVHTCTGTGGGLAAKNYILMLQTSGGSTLATFKINHQSDVGYYNVTLESTTNGTQILDENWNQFVLTFAGGKLSLTLNGTPCLSDVPYSVGIVGRLRFETTVSMSGGGCHFDNLKVQAIPPAPPVLDTIRPNPDYDKNVFIQWTAVSGATSYKVYRDTTQITALGPLTPIGTPATTYFVDNSIASAGTYWYAVVATNASGDSGLSNSRSTTVGVSDPDLIFWEDFDNDTFDANPFPWTSNNNFPSSMFFCARGSWGIGSDHPTPYLDVGDNQAGDYVWGYANLPTSLTDGSLAFDVHTCTGTGGGLAAKQYIIMLQTSGGSTLVTFRINHQSDVGYYNVSLGSSTNGTQLGDENWNHFVLTFSGNKLNLTLNGTKPVFTDLSYTGGSIGRIRFETTDPMSGGGCHFDNLMVMNATATPPEPENGILFTLEPGTQQVIVKDSDHVTVICAFTITVLTTIQMIVSAYDTNPSSIGLTNGLRFFTIEVLSGSYDSTIIPVKFYYKDSGLSASSESQLKVHYLSGSFWTNIGGQVYVSANYVFINLDHFSTYAIVTPSGTTNPNEIPIEYYIGALLAFLAFLGIYLIIKFRGKHGAPADSAAGELEFDFDP